MSTYSAKSGLKVKQNGGAAMSAGRNDGTSAISADRLYSKENDLGVFGSTVVSGRDVNSASVIDTEVGQLNDLNATLNTLYQTPKPVERSIHKTESSRTLQYTTAFRNGYYNVFTGGFFVDPTSQVDSFGTDDAANPTRETPGELTYRTGAPLAKSSKYESKNG
jgi:hypothetical protein